MSRDVAAAPPDSESPQVKVGVYVRISEDELGLEKGIARQTSDGEDLARQRGWVVRDVYADNDLSASKGAPRPGYDRLMEAAQTGHIDRIVVWQSSRLWRNRRERAEGIEILSRAGVSVTPVKGPELDFSTAYGRGMAGMLGEFDTMESEVKSERVTRAAQQRAQEGRANGPVLYGWRREYDQDDQGRIVGFRDVENPDEAAIVREVTRRLLRGEALRGVTADLNRRRVPAPGARQVFRKKTHAAANPDGALWSHTSLRKLALRPANAGLRIYHRGRPDERLLPAAWPALVSRAQWDQLRALLTRPAAAAAKPGGRRYLLTSGVGQCGVCGGTLRVGWKGNHRHGSKQQLYLCDAKQCVGRRMMFVDELVRRMVLARLAEPDALDWMYQDDTAARKAAQRGAELRARLNTAADQYADGRITAEQLERITARLRPEIAEADRAARASGMSLDPSLFADLAGPEAAARWKELGIAQQRALLEALGLTVMILPARRRGPGFDSSAVRFLPWDA